jgi:hypothetical protein
MKRNGFTEEQVLAIVKEEGEVGRKVSDLCGLRAPLGK